MFIFVCKTLLLTQQNYNYNLHISYINIVYLILITYIYERKVTLKGWDFRDDCTESIESVLTFMVTLPATENLLFSGSL